MRFRLLSLFLLTAVVAVIVAALVSHSRDWTEVKRLDTEVKSALEQIEPEVAEHLQINQGREELPRLSAYSFAGNGSGRTPGGLVDGSSSIERYIVVADAVDVTIDARSDWKIFAGRPYVVIHSGRGPENEWFIKLLASELSDRGITPRTSN